MAKKKSGKKAVKARVAKKTSKKVVKKAIVRKVQKPKNPRIASKTLTRKVPENTSPRTETTEQDRRHQARLATAGTFRSFVEEIAQDRRCKVNWAYPGGEKEFKGRSQMWHVDRYFEHSQFGPLLMDRPSLPRDVEECKEKAKVLRKLGYLYLYITTEVNYGKAVEILEEQMAEFEARAA